MGRKEDAIREGRRAVELKPESKDAVDGAIMNCYLALIYARVGEKDLAFRSSNVAQNAGRSGQRRLQYHYKRPEISLGMGPDSERSAFPKTL